MTTTKEKSNKSQPFSFRFSSDIYENLIYYSKIFRRNKSSIVEEALENYFSDLEQQKEVFLKFEKEKKDDELKKWQLEGVEKAKKQIKEGKSIDGDKMMKWFKSLNTDKVLPRPSEMQ